MSNDDVKWILLGIFLISGCRHHDEPCPWTTSTGRTSCGARPPRHRVPPAQIARWLPLAEPMALETDGLGARRELAWSVDPVDFTDHAIYVALEAEGISRAARFELVLGDAAMANSFRFPLHSTQGQLWIPDGEPVAVTVPWSGYRTTGTPDRTRISDVAVRVADDASGAPLRVQLGGIALVPEPTDRYPRGVLSFTFDDNHVTMISEGAPVLDAYGFPATAYVIVEHVDGPERATLVDLHDRHARGWDIAAHAFSIAAHDARWTTLAPADLEHEIVESRAWLIANGFTGYDHCAYPGGDFTGATDVLALTRTYFTSCRTIYQRQRETFPPADPHKLRVFYVTSSTTLEAAKAAVDDAVAARAWIILGLHRLVDDPQLSTEWSKQDFAALVEHVARSGIAVETVTDVLEPRN